MIYSTFWQRLGPWFLDFVCYVPIFVLFALLGNLGRNFYVGCGVLGILVNFLFYVFMVRRFGGTPGKLLMGLRIVKTDGSPVGYREAFLRNVVELSLSVLAWLALMIGTLRMTDTEYFSLGWQHRITAQMNLAPEWHVWVSVLFRIWSLSLVIVMLVNNRRRTTHDFVAGTVVVKHARNEQSISDEVPV